MIEERKLDAGKPEDRCWLPETQFFTARAADSDGEWFLAAKGGHNDESHNHNDVGQFVVYRDGLPLLIDVGVETYRAQTFSARRYEIWTMQSGWHNLPRVNGYEQSVGEQFRAGAISADTSAEQPGLDVDIARAYPSEANIVKWKRSVRLRGAKGVDLEERFHLREEGGEIVLHLVTPSVCRVGENRIEWIGRELPHGLHSATGSMRWEGLGFKIEIEERAIEDAKLADVWGPSLHRIRLSARVPGREGCYKISFR